MPKNYDLFLRGGVGGWNFSVEMVNFILDKNKDREVHVLIDSLGGYTSDAVSISSLFKLHGNVHVHFVGHNASAATIAAMGAKKVTIDEDGAFLVHKCLNLVFEWDWLNADELDEHIRKLEKMKEDQSVIDDCVAGMYARRCKKSKDELLALMKKGGWLTPEQALEWGFVDEITHYKEDAKPEISEAMIKSLSAAGIPLPPNLCKKKGSIMDRFLNFLQSPFSTTVGDGDPEAAENNSQNMPELTTLAALLGCTLAFVDNKLSLSDDQARKVNDSLEKNKRSVDSLTASVAEKDKTIAELQASLAEKNKTISELRKSPAVDTVEVHEEKKDDDKYAPVSAADAIAASKAFFDAYSR